MLGLYGSLPVDGDRNTRYDKNNDAQKGEE
jgi:hypothetical protein